MESNTKTIAKRVAAHVDIFEMKVMFRVDMPSKNCLRNPIIVVNIALKILIQLINSRPFES